MLQAFDNRFPESKGDLRDNVVNSCIPFSFLLCDLPYRAEYILVGVSCGSGVVAPCSVIIGQALTAWPADALNIRCA